jgi:hypothetical protein
VIFRQTGEAVAGNKALFPATPNLTSDAVFYATYAFVAGAVGATVKSAADFDAVTDDFATTMLTLRRQGLDGAFEGIKHMPLAFLDHLE